MARRAFKRLLENPDEPEHVFVLMKLNSSVQVVFAANLILRLPYIDCTITVVPCRYPMSPPQLTRNTPIFDVFHPVTVCILEFLRMKLNISIHYLIQSWTSKTFHINIPLQ